MMRFAVRVIAMAGAVFALPGCVLLAASFERDEEYAETLRLANARLEQVRKALDHV